MKRTVAFILILIVAAASLSALDFVVGPKVMVADMNARGEDFTMDNRFSLSLAGGAFANIQLTNMIGIQPEVYFNSISSKSDNGANEVEIRFPVLTVPVYARFDFDLAKIGVYALAGVRFDFRLSDEGKRKINGGSASDYDISGYNAFFFGAAGGAGVSLPLGPGVLDLGLGGYFGFTKLQDPYKSYPWDLDVQVGYGFSF